MNHQPTAPQFDNPWKDRSKFEPMPKGRTALQLAMLLLSTLALPLSLFHEAVAPVVLLALFGYVIVAVRTPLTVISVLLSAVLPVLLIGTFASGAVILSCIVGIACGTWLLTVHKSAFWTLLLPVASFGISFVITGDWMLSAIALFPIPAILLLRVAVLRGEKRTTAICFAEGGLLLSLFILIGAWIYTVCGSLNQAAIAAYIEGLRQELTQLLISVRDVLLENLKVAGESNLAAYEHLAASMNDANLLGIVQQLFNLIPAFAVIVCSIVAYEAQMLLNFIYRFTGMKQVVTPVSFVFTMSIPAAVLYVVSFFVSVFATGPSLAVALMDNLCLMLLPGFLLVGFGSMLTAFAAMKRNGGGFFLILTFALLCCCSSSALYLLALWGANTVLTAPLYRKMAQKTDNDNQNSDSM